LRRQLPPILQGEEGSAVSVMTDQRVDLRCPIGPKQLLARVVWSGDHIAATEAGLVELACRDCAKNERKKDPEVKRVLHRFRPDGVLVESLIER